MNRPPAWLSSASSNIVTDLVGDPVSADLRLAMSGNQWMLVPELVRLWSTAYPDVARVFYETLPPGLVVAQARTGVVGIGALTLPIRPDAVAAGPDMLAELVDADLIDEPVDYARNDLALLTSTSGVGVGREWALEDLGRDDVRVAMPDPRTEGVGRLIVRALDAAGGPALVAQVMERKVDTGATLLTSIHHRESAAWLQTGTVDIAPLWSTEAAFHAGAETGLRAVAIAPEVNQTGRYCIAAVKTGRAIGAQVVDFMTSPAVLELYDRYGFCGPQ